MYTVVPQKGEKKHIKVLNKEKYFKVNIQNKTKSSYTLQVL